MAIKYPRLWDIRDLLVLILSLFKYLNNNIMEKSLRDLSNNFVFKGVAPVLAVVLLAVITGSLVS